MGRNNGYNQQQQQQHRQLQHHNSFHNSRSFLPLLCRLSIKDVKFPKHDRSDSDRSSSSSEDPSSPKVSCIGQVKKRNNKIISCPTTFNTAPPKSADNLKYAKLRKLFSGKNLLTSATTIHDTSSTHHSCKIRTTTTKEVVMIRNSSTGTMRLRRPAPPPPTPKLTSNDESVNVVELDPPLPVVKKVQQPGGCGRDEVNLWKRRCGGAGNGIGIRLQSLQVQQIHVPNQNTHHHLPPTTV